MFGTDINISQTNDVGSGRIRLRKTERVLGRKVVSFNVVCPLQEDPDQIGRREDTQIAFTWRKFLYEDPDKPVQLNYFAMVKV